METERKKIRLREINEYLTCSLCHGYLIDATTIVECLHSFCRTCIVHYLHTSNFCPTCECVIAKKNPHQNIRSDRLLQDIVYKIVPGLFKDELRRRQDYFIKNNHPQEDWDRIARHSRRRFFSQDEKISLCLELSGRKKHGKFVNKNNTKEASRRYLLCPAKITIRHLKKFLQLKFSLSGTHKIDMWHSYETLTDEYTLIDVAYVIRWKRKKPMRIQYCIYTVNKQPTVENQSQNHPIDACANSPGNDSGIEDVSPSFEVSFEEPSTEEHDVININDVVEKAVKVVDEEEEESATLTIDDDDDDKENEIKSETSEHENTMDKHESGCEGQLTESESAKNSSQLTDESLSPIVEHTDDTEEKTDTTDDEKECIRAEIKRDAPETEEQGKVHEKDCIKSREEEGEGDLLERTPQSSPDGDGKETSGQRLVSEQEDGQEKEADETVECAFTSSAPENSSDSPVTMETKDDKTDGEEDESESMRGKNTEEGTRLEGDEVDEDQTNTGPTFNDSVAQTSPYYDDDDESEEFWNEGAIDLSKPKMIVIEPLKSGDDDEQTEKDDDGSEVQKPAEVVTESMKLPIEVVECEMEEQGEECHVEEYTYVVDGIHEIENPIETDYRHINSGINEHSYSMLPNAEPVAINAKVEPVRNIYKPTISIPKLPPKYLQHTSARSFASAFSYDLPCTSSMASRNSLMTSRNLVSSNTQPTGKTKKKYERSPQVAKESKTGCKKRVRKCTSVCNGHSVSPRGEKLVVKLSKARNSNSYTATMS